MNYQQPADFPFDKDPIAWARLNAELTAKSPAHLELLDAVLEGDLDTLKGFMGRANENHPFTNYLTLPISTLMLTSPHRDVARMLVHEAIVHEGSRVNEASPYNTTFGRLAVAVCSVEQQKELLSMGFLSASNQATHGMQSSDPDVFNLWCDAYCAHLAEHLPATHPHYQEIPSEVFQSIPRITRQGGKPPSAVQLELSRRQQRIFEGFLAVAYPAENEEARWISMLARPPKPVRIDDRQEHVDKIVGLMNYQLDKVPHLRQEKVRINVPLEHGTQTAHALLRSGYPVSSFENDLIGEVFKILIKTLASRHNVPEPLSLLWAEMLESLSRDDPRKLAQLPRELVQPGLDLKQLCGKMPADERESLSELLSISLNTAAAANRPRSGPRL